jgi:cytochrome P450
MALDPNIWGNPDELHGFRAFRFTELRSASKTDANKFQFATTSPANSVYFGRGKHDCPRRFFASSEIKTIVAYLIRKYDIKAARKARKASNLHHDKRERSKLLRQLRQVEVRLPEFSSKGREGHQKGNLTTVLSWFIDVWRAIFPA